MARLPLEDMQRRTARGVCTTHNAAMTLNQGARLRLEEERARSVGGVGGRARRERPRGQQRRQQARRPQLPPVQQHHRLRALAQAPCAAARPRSRVLPELWLPDRVG